MKRLLVAAVVVGTVTVAALGLWVQLVDRKESPVAEYVGGQTCARCHEQETERWSGSHHDLAMQVASAGSVLGNFDSVTHVRRGESTTFYEADGRFLVQTHSVDREPEEFEVKYTFGVYPLQQYLVEYQGGRYQALTVAWDSRPADEGGQRWFDLYPDAALTPEHPLHWTQPQQNWNRTCAECHSTNLSRGLDTESGSYTTTYTDIDVACEACHGPGSVHVEITERERTREPDSWGITASTPDTLREWVFDQGQSIAHRIRPRQSDAEINVCVHCHSRRSRIWDGYTAGDEPLDYFAIANLRSDLYFPDGQILDEVYEYGSFVQSRMYRAGVTCSDCHDPHSQALKADGNALCGQCHAPSVYDAPNHHFHETSSPGSQCVSCHMPARTYMVVDSRRDHSLRIPEPGVSSSIGAPDACTSCHIDQTPAWATGILEGRGGLRAPSVDHVSTIFYAADRRDPAAVPSLETIARDTTLADIVRASAISRLGSYVVLSDVVLQALSSDVASIRLAAVAALGQASADELRASASLLLEDSVRSVRIEAARVVASAPPEMIQSARQPALQRGLTEFIESQHQNADHPASWINLGNLHVALGRPDSARAAFETALTVDSLYLPAYLNLADLLRATGRDRLAESTLMRALELFPESAEVQHAIGLQRVRQQDLEEALEWLARAASGDSGNARFSYVYGVAVASAGDVARGVAVLESAVVLHPFDPDILAALVAYNRDLGDVQTALEYAERLVEVAPDNEGARELLSQLRAR